MSRPLRARGLKQDIYEYEEAKSLSRPLRARGLKLHKR